MKCAALAIFSAFAGLMIRRFNPELGFALSAATAAVLLLSCTALLENLVDSFREAEGIFGSVSVQMRPMLKCLGIAAASRLGADFCRDASQTALAAAVEMAGSLCAAAVSLPMILSVMTTIGGLL